MLTQLQKKCTAFIILLMVFSSSIEAQWLNSGTNIYNTNTGKVGIGTGTTTVPTGLLTVKGAGSVPASAWVNAGAPLFAGFGETTVGNSDYILSMASAAANARPVFIGRRSRGTLAAPTVVSNNDYLSSFLVSGFDGSAFQNPAAVDFYVDGAPLAGSVPARISFVTGSNGANRLERLKIGSTGNFTFNNTQLYLDNGSGNVGVGTTSPSQKFYVNGTAATTGALFVDANAANDGGLATGGGLKFGDAATGEGIVSKRTVGGNQYGLDLIAGGASRLSVTNSGNIGIGTSTPGAKLEINGQIKITGGALPPVAGSVLTSDATGLATWQLPSSGGSQWTTSGNDVYNNNSGNVGIGNSNPTRAKLEVNGVAGSGNTSAIFGGDGTGISIQRNWPTIGFNQYRDVATGNGKAIGNGYGMQLNLDPSTGTCYMSMQDSVGANASFVNTPVKGISIFKNGFVHVGNNNITDQASLSISGSSNFPSHFNFGTNGHTYIRGGSKTYGGVGIYSTRRPSKVYINDLQGEDFLTGNVKPGGDVILVAGGGKVGVGVDNPTSPLSFPNTLGNKISLWNNGTTADFGIGIQSGTMQFYTAGQDQFAFGYGNSANFTQTMTYYPGSAQLGINCLPQAGYQLAVNGSVRAKEIRVETGWADYVFADNYKLRSLSEVEDFIKTNKHLPDVTAGDVIEKEGLEVGKTSAQMIKKIEELTLYVIEQEKSINALKEHNLKLESAINLLIEKGGK